MRTAKEKKSSLDKASKRSSSVRGVPVRRAAGIRGVRQRRAPAQAAEEPQHHQVDKDDANEDDEEVANEAVDLTKVGAKKRAKLEAKAERKAQREIEVREREERKRREQQLQEERDKESAREREEERKREKTEQKAREEKERREHEEYLKLKETFSVEEEGFESKDDESQQNILMEFVNYIKINKVFILVHLAQHFNMKTSHVIDRIQQMQADGILSGVIDDRGKFIYISRKELEAVAKFAKQRGRVSITELAEHSNSLINLTPETQCNTIEA